MIWLGKMRIHIEAVGGLAGDMFIAAMLNLRALTNLTTCCVP